MSLCPFVHLSLKKSADSHEPADEYSRKIELENKSLRFISQIKVYGFYIFYPQNVR